jgi:hypothetical protein
VSLDIYIVALFLSLPSRDEAKGAEEVGNPRPIIPVGLVLLVLRGCGLAMKEKPIIGATGWSYYPYPSICWQAGSPVWRIEPAASGLQRDVYGCLREVAGGPLSPRPVRVHRPAAEGADRPGCRDAARGDREG